MQFTTLVMTWKDKKRKEKRKTEFLQTLVTFKIATRVALSLNIHNQDSQLMTKHEMF